MIHELVRELKAGDVFFDLGAYVGPYTLLASRLVGEGGRVVAFEPDPATRDLLDRNLAANGASNVTVVPSAVGRAAGACRSSPAATQQEWSPSAETSKWSR